MQDLAALAERDRVIVAALDCALAAEGITLEDLLDALARTYARAGEHEPLGPVRGCLEAAAEYLSDASFAIYAAGK